MDAGLHLHLELRDPGLQGFHDVLAEGLLQRWNRMERGKQQKQDKTRSTRRAETDFVRKQFMTSNILNSTGPRLRRGNSSSTQPNVRHLETNDCTKRT